MFPGRMLQKTPRASYRGAPAKATCGQGADLKDHLPHNDRRLLPDAFLRDFLVVLPGPGTAVSGC
jgi:hypothetical protein